MKDLAKQLMIAIHLLLLVLAFNGLNAQVQNAPMTETDFQYTICNVTSTSATTFEFDLYLQDMDPANPMELASTQAGILLNPAIYNSGIISATLVAGYSELPAAMVPTSLAYTQSTNLIKLPARTPPGAGAGPIISSVFPGTRITRMRVTNSVPFTACTGADLSFTPSTAVTPSYPSRVSIYLSGVSTQLTVIPGSNAIALSNPPLGIPAPNMYTVSGTGTYCQGSAGLPVSLSGSEAGVTYQLYRNGIAAGGLVSGTGSTITWPDQQSGTYTISGSYYCMSGPMNGSAVITMNPAPAAAGLITGSPSVAPGTTGVSFSVPPIINAASYSWAYSGTGVTIHNGTGNNITADFSSTATNGSFTVFGANPPCNGAVSQPFNVTVGSKILTLSSLFLEGLYTGSGSMSQASDENGAPRSGPGVADLITVEFHNPNAYSNIEYTAGNIPLSTTGTATVAVPLALSGSYYIAVRHRNSIQTVSSSPVSFAGGSIAFSFGSPAAVYGGNLRMMTGPVNEYVIYGGDVNLDGIVDGGDLAPVDNLASQYAAGYLPEDINGDGIIDGSDLALVDNNSAGFVSAALPE